MAGAMAAGRLGKPCRSILLWGFWLMLLVGVLAGCAARVAANDQRKDHMASPTIEDVLNKHAEEWLAIPGVVGAAVGESNGRPCIQILVVKKTRELSSRLPSRVEGRPVVIKETGEIRALGKE